MSANYRLSLWTKGESWERDTRNIFCGKIVWLAKQNSCCNIGLQSRGALVLHTLLSFGWSVISQPLLFQFSAKWCSMHDTIHFHQNWALSPTGSILFSFLSSEKKQGHVKWKCRGRKMFLLSLWRLCPTLGAHTPPLFTKGNFWLMEVPHSRESFWALITSKISTLLWVWVSVAYLSVLDQSK